MKVQILKVKEMVKRFKYRKGKNKVSDVEGVQLNIQRGEKIGIVGE